MTPPRWIPPPEFCIPGHPDVTVPAAGYLGQGAEVVVFEGRRAAAADPPEPVCVRVFQPLDPGWPAEQFVWSAKRAAALTSDHLVEVSPAVELALGPGGPRYAQVAEWCDTTLQEEIDNLIEANIRLPITTTQRLLYGLARALAALHRQGLVHRDVRPSNIFLNWSGDGAVGPSSLATATIKLGDYGTLAKRGEHVRALSDAADMPRPP